MDTSDEANRIMTRLLRAMTPEQRLQKALEHSEGMREFRRLNERERKGLVSE